MFIQLCHAYHSAGGYPAEEGSEGACKNRLTIVIERQPEYLSIICDDGALV